MLIPLVMLAAVSIRLPDTPLRAGCAADSPVKAVLPAGAEVRVRFAYAGETSCYKVAVELGGRVVEGYVLPHQLDGLDGFVAERQAAGDAGNSVKVMTARIAEVRERAAKSVTLTPELRTAIEAIDQNEPARALTMLEPAIRSRPDPGVLALAGVAAWKSDDPRTAIEYWKRSLALRADPDLESLARSVEREAAADKSSGRAYGLRVLLRYEPGAVKPELARTMVLALDSELERIAGELGCVARERLVAVVQSRESYLASTGAAEWSGGRYDGRIRIALLDEAAVGPRTRRVFAHELVHACLSNMGRWPAWLHEGLAQRLSGDELTAAERARLKQLIASKGFPRLEELGRDLASMNSAAARDVYALALLAAEQLVAGYGGVGIRNVLANPSLLAQATGELNRSLGL